MPLLVGLSGEKLECSGQCFRKIPTVKIVQLICQVVVGLSVVHDDAKHWINRCPVDNRFPRPTENVKAACTDLSCGF